MAHELSYDAAGNAQMFSVGETPWHREGKVLRAAPTLVEALELGGLNFEVACRPVYREMVNASDPSDTYFQESQKARVVVRTDTLTELGGVGMEYTPVQNRDAFGILQPLLDEGLLSLETGGSLRGGADVWMLGKFDLSRFGPEAREVLGGGALGGADQQVDPYALIANNHSGRRGCLLSLTPIRVVCANTLGMAEGEAAEGRSTSLVVRHTQNVEAKLVEAAEELFKGIVARYEVIARQYKKLKALHLDTAMFRELVLNVVAPDPRKDRRFNPEARMANAVVARWEQKVGEVTRLWTAGKGHVGDQAAWEAYNGAVEAIDHNTELFPKRTGVYRTQQLLDGELRTMKVAVLNGLVRAAEKHNDALARAV